MITDVYCPDRTTPAHPRLARSFDSSADAEMWLEAEHCNQLAEDGSGQPLRVCERSATALEHEMRQRPG